jgi:hypothetical protein
MEGFPFMLWPGTGPVRRLRHVARKSLFAHHPPGRRWLLRTIMTLAWPAGAVWETIRSLGRISRADRPAGAWGWVQRASHMLALAWTDNVLPRNYVMYRLHDPARHSRIGFYFYGAEIQSLATHLNRLCGAVAQDVRDKARFADLCRAHALPSIPTLAVFRGGVQCVPAEPFLPDAPDLWVKDLAGCQGSGAARWRREGDAYRHAWDGGVRCPLALAAQWRERDCIIQPCLKNHPALAPLSDGSLVVLRVITGMDRGGRMVVITALAQFPCGGAGMHQIFAGVGPDGEILFPLLRGQPVARHPDSGAELEGTRVPFWPEALDLVVRAHRSVPEFSRFVFLGWDVAITGDGPLLIETNAGWGAVNHQLGHGVPLGLTALPSIALDHLEALSPCG